MHRLVAFFSRGDNPWLRPKIATPNASAQGQLSPIFGLAWLALSGLYEIWTAFTDENVVAKTGSLDFSGLADTHLTRRGLRNLSVRELMLCRRQIWSVCSRRVRDSSRFGLPRLRPATQFC